MNNYLVIVIIGSFLTGLIGLSMAVRELRVNRYVDQPEIQAVLLFLGSITAFAVALLFTLLWVHQLSIN